MLIPARVDALPYSIFVLNQAVPRHHRHEFFNYIRKNFSEYFSASQDLHKDIDDINQTADNVADAIEAKFVEINANNDTLPLFDFEISLNDWS